MRLVAALTMVALAARLIHLGTRPLWLDEAYSAWFSSRSWTYLWAVVPTYETHPPFYYSILKVWRTIAGGSPIALRSLSVLLSLAIIPVVVGSALEIERLRPSGRPLLAAGIAGFLAACSPMMINLGQEARPYPLLILAYSAAVLGILRLMREFRDGGPGAWRSWCLLGVGTEVALWSHSLGAIYAACIAASLAPAFLSSPSGGRIARGVGVAAAVVVAYLPCVSIILGRAGDWGAGWLAWRPELLVQLIGLYSIPGEAITIASIVAALVMLLLIKRAIQFALEGRGWTADRTLLILWLGPPAIAAIVSATIFPIFLPRTLCATLIPAYLAIGFAVARTPSGQERRMLAAALAITLLPTAVQVAAREPVEPWDAIHGYLASHAAPQDQIWLYPNDSALPLNAVAGSPLRTRGLPGNYPAIGFKGPIRAGSPAVVSLTHDETQAVANDPRLARVPVIWLVTRQSALFDPRDDLPRALGEVRRAGKMQQWGYIAVQPFYATVR